jgi:D-alanyl-D-alanine carboxypeptidase (penicillin-binding protein 5/6)
MPVPVTLGTCDYVQPVLGSEESILMKKSDVSKIEKTIELSDGVTAPVEEGQILGSFTMTLDGEELLKTDIVASSAVSRLSVWSIFKNFVRIFFCGDS